MLEYIEFLQGSKPSARYLTHIISSNTYSNPLQGIVSLNLQMTKMRLRGING